eukprot:6478644-Amphidinium_carterae.1
MKCGLYKNTSTTLQLGTASFPSAFVMHMISNVNCPDHISSKLYLLVNADSVGLGEVNTNTWPSRMCF